MERVSVSKERASGQYMDFTYTEFLQEDWVMQTALEMAIIRLLFVTNCVYKMNEFNQWFVKE